MNAHELFEHLRDEHSQDLGWAKKLEFMKVLHSKLHQREDRRNELVEMRRQLDEM